MSTENIVDYSMEEAAQLIADVGGYDPITEAEDLIKKSETTAQFNEYLERRINSHEPVAYITNHAKFRGLSLFIDERVLIPRPETEALVQVAVEEIPQGAKVADVGTGSGAVALALKNERPDLTVEGFDISKDALDVACINSTAFDIKVGWHAADLLHGVKSEFDAVLANMPYLPIEKRDTYAPEMVDYEPEIALWGGQDGFSLIRELLGLAQGRPMVKLVALEIGLGTAEDVTKLLWAHNFPNVFCTTDSKLNIRAVIGKR